MLCKGMYFDLKMNSFCVSDAVLGKSYRFKRGIGDCCSVKIVEQIKAKLYNGHDYIIDLSICLWRDLSVGYFERVKRKFSEK